MVASTGNILLSIVAPCYNEEEGLAEFVRRTLAAAQRVLADDEFEVVLVDDGSSDRTWEIITSLATVTPQIVGVRLLRNHGHQLAATSGLATACGARVLLIDADLQDPPELLSNMMAIMDKEVDVVYGQRTQRKGETVFKRATASLFYRLLSWLTPVSIPRDTGDFRLMSRRVVNILLNMPERAPFIRGMVSWIGGRQEALPYTRDPRFSGETKYPLSKMIRFAMDAITGFSTVPLRISTWLGIMTSGFAFVLLIYTMWQWAANNVITGWSSLMAALTGFAAIQLIVLGIIGEYLGQLVQESKGRPMFMIDRIVRNGQCVQIFDQFPPRTKNLPVMLNTLDDGRDPFSTGPLRRSDTC